MPTKFKQPEGTITSKQIMDRYNVTGDAILITRKRLEILGYIEAVRKGSQTHRILKDGMPPNLYDLEQEYLYLNYHYTMPDDYTFHIVNPLNTLVKEFEKWDSGQWGNMNPDIAEAHRLLVNAQNILPELSLPFSFRFKCAPKHDALIIRSSRQKRIENLANLLEVTAQELRWHLYRYHPYGYESPHKLIELTAGILKQITVPNAIEEHLKRV